MHFLSSKTWALNNFAQIGRRDFHVKRNSASLFNIYVGERKQSAVHREDQSTVNKFASDNSRLGSFNNFEEIIR